MTPPTTPAAPSVTIIYPPKDMEKPIAAKKDYVACDDLCDFLEKDCQRLQAKYKGDVHNLDPMADVFRCYNIHFQMEFKALKTHLAMVWQGLHDWHDETQRMNQSILVLDRIKCIPPDKNCGIHNHIQYQCFFKQYANPMGVNPFVRLMLHLQELNHYDKLSDLPSFNHKNGSGFARGASERSRRARITHNAAYHAKLSEKKEPLHEHVPLVSMKKRYTGERTF